MNVNSLSNTADAYIHSLIRQPASSTTGSNSIDPSSLSLPRDGTPQLSPFAQVLNTLQQLQQSNPGEYNQVTSQIATNLQNAADTASSQGNTSQANELNQLANDFKNAAQNNTLPNIQDLAQAMHGGHGHHHHMHAADSSSATSNTTASGASAFTTSSSSSNPLSQLISMFFSNAGSATQNNSLDPMSIITSTLSQASL